MLSEALVPIRMRPASSAQALQHLDGGLELPHGARAVLEEELACARRERSLAHALDEGQPERGLELADLHADRRLREPELGGGAREAPVAHHRVERPRLSQREGQVHAAKSSLWSA